MCTTEQAPLRSMSISRSLAMVLCRPRFHALAQAHQILIIIALELDFVHGRAHQKNSAAADPQLVGRGGLEMFGVDGLALVAKHDLQPTILCIAEQRHGTVGIALVGMLHHVAERFVHRDRDVASFAVVEASLPRDFLNHGAHQAQPPRVAGKVQLQLVRQAVSSSADSTEFPGDYNINPGRDLWLSRRPAGPRFKCYIAWSRRRPLPPTCCTRGWRSTNGTSGWLRNWPWACFAG